MSYPIEQGSVSPGVFRMIAVCAFIICARAASAAETSHLGLNQEVLVVCMKYDDILSTRKATCQEWIDTLNVEVNEWYDAATSGRTTFIFKHPDVAPADGWFTMTVGRQELSFFGVDDALEQAGAVLTAAGTDLSGFDRVVMIVNDMEHFGQSTQGFGSWVQVAKGGERDRIINGTTVHERYVTAAVAFEADPGFSRYDNCSGFVMHELAHNLGAREHHGDIYVREGWTYNVLGPWSIMGEQSSNPAHFVAWSKEDRGWLRFNSILDVTPGTMNRSFALQTHARSTTPPPGTYELVTIPFAASQSSFEGYTIEARWNNENFDQVHENGVLVSYVDGDAIYPWVPFIVQYDPSSPDNVYHAALEPGDVFIDTQRGIRIAVEGQPSPGTYALRVDSPTPAIQRPDLFITPWVDDNWESADIWIDSPRNGTNVFKYHDANGNPTGNGDEPWAGRANDVYFRVRNIGDADAVNVKINAYWAPANAGEGDWHWIGNNIYPKISAGGATVGKVVWTPALDSTDVCLKVVIEEDTGESNARNNVAQENVWTFDTTHNSPWHQVSQTVEVRNPYMDRSLPVAFTMRNLPEQWAFAITPARLMLAPGASATATFDVFPGGPPDGPESIGYEAGYIGKTSFVALGAWEGSGTYVPLGGGSIWTRLTTATQLSCTASMTGKTVTVSGHLAGPPPAQVVAIEFVQGADRHYVYATSNPESDYQTAWRPPATGAWTAQSFYTGSGAWGDSESAPCSFYVQ